jgi:hypothetical protein
MQVICFILGWVFLALAMTALWFGNNISLNKNKYINRNQLLAYQIASVIFALFGTYFAIHLFMVTLR